MGKAILIFPCSSALSRFSAWQHCPVRRAWLRRNGFHSCPRNVTLTKLHLLSASFFLTSYSFFLWDFFFVLFFGEKYHPYWIHLKRNPCPVRILEDIVRKIRVSKPHNCLLTPLSSVIVQLVLLTQQGELEILKFPYFPIHFQRWTQKLVFFPVWVNNILFGVFLHNWGLKYAATSLVLESKHSLHYRVVWEGIEITTRPFTT